MLNGFGQTKIDPRLIAEQMQQHPKRIHSGWEAAARALAVGLGAHNRQTGINDEKAERQTALADALASMNRGSLTSEGPTNGAAANAAIPDPQGLAKLFDNESTRPLAMAMYSQATAPKPERGIIEGADGYNYYKDTRERVLPDVTKAEPKLSPRDAAFSSMPLNEQQDILRKAGQTNINLPSSAQETEEAKKFGGLLVNRYQKVLEEADAAANQLSVVHQARALNESALPSQLKLTAGNVMQSIGINPESVPGFELVTNGQQFNAVMERAVLSAMQAQKGPQTESDQRRIKSTVAGIGNTAEAREFLLDSAEAMNTMKTMKAEYWRNHRAEKGTLAGAEKAWADTFGKAGLVRRWVDAESGASEIFFFPEWFAEARRHPDNRDLTDQELIKHWKSYE